jgi:hypothetical protein
LVKLLSQHLVAERGKAATVPEFVRNFMRNFITVPVVWPA